MDNIIFLREPQSGVSNVHSMMQQWIENIAGCLAETSHLLSTLPPSEGRDLLSSEIVELRDRLKTARQLTDEVLPSGRLPLRAR